MNGDMFPEAVVPKVDENRRYTTRTFMNFIMRVAGVDGWDLDVDADMESHKASRYFASPADGRMVPPRPPHTIGAVEHAGCSYRAPAGGLCNKCGRWMPTAFDSLAQSWLPDARWHEAGSQTASNRSSPSWPVRRCYRLFDNPPFDDIEPRLAKVWATIGEANRLGIELRIAMVMPGNRTEQGFWQDHVEPFLEGHPLAGREGYRLVAYSPRTRQFYGHPGNPEPKSGQAEWPSVVLVWRRA